MLSSDLTEATRMGASISFSGKHVVITGGSEGIGLALAECFASDGAIVSLLSRSTLKLEKAQKHLQVRSSLEKMLTCTLLGTYVDDAVGNHWGGSQWRPNPSTDGALCGVTFKSRPFRPKQQDVCS